MDEAGEKPNWWRRRNWWRIGFFVMLLLFEFAREWAVIASYPEPKIATSNHVGSYGGFTRATGRWVRLDGGGSMVPSAVVIECSEEQLECLEVSAHVNEGYLGEPVVDRFNATFAADAVTYENNNPDCPKYAVRIDLKLKKVIAVRDRKDSPTNEMCNKLERRIEMTLGEGYQKSDNPFDGHFVPVMVGVVAVFKLFE